MSAERKSKAASPQAKAPPSLRSGGALHKSVSPERAEPPELPEGWKIRRLGELLREVDVRQADLPPEEASRLPVLSLTKNDGLILQSERFGKRIATEDTSHYKVVRWGQIVFNPYVIWEGAIHALQKYPAGLVSPVYAVWETSEPDGGFLDHLVRTPQLIEAYNRVCSGAVNRRRAIRQKDFLAIRVAVPEIAEQRAIAGVLRTVQAAREACERLLAATRQLKQSLLHHLFTYGPVPLSQADQVPLKQTEIGPMPEHWDVLGFEESLSHPNFSVGKVPKNAYVQVGRWPVIDQGQETVAARTDDEALVYRGPLPLILFGDHTRVFKFVDTPFACGADGTKLLHPDPRRFDPLFFFHCCCRLAIPSRGYNRHYKLLREQRLPCPPLSEQREIAAMLGAVDGQIAALEARRAALAALFTSLLEHLMTGRLRLPEFVK